jgi:chromosome condensin MukBEF MukE localization factor
MYKSGKKRRKTRRLKVKKYRRRGMVEWMDENKAKYGIELRMIGRRTRSKNARRMGGTINGNERNCKKNKKDTKEKKKEDGNEEEEIIIKKDDTEEE